MGIEPTSEAWEASILPLNYARSALNQAKNIISSAARATSPAAGHVHRTKNAPVEVRAGYLISG